MVVGISPAAIFAKALKISYQNKNSLSPYLLLKFNSGCDED
jgi:hypothetical protein